ncbi:hypothetical protein MRX96_059437 [Rhipicephalus microplus]
MLLGGPQPLLLITNELTMIPSSPSVQVNEATQTHLVVHPSYCAVPGSSEPFRLVDVFRPVSVSTVPDLYRVVSTTFAPGWPTHLTRRLSLLHQFNPTRERPSRLQSPYGYQLYHRQCHYLFQLTPYTCRPKCP